MIGIITFPYRMADPHSIRGPAWMMDGGNGILGERIADWDPGRSLALIGRLEIDRDEFMRSCGLGPADEVVITASWRCTLTHHREAQVQGPWPIAKIPDGVDLHLTTPSGVLDEGIALRVAVSLRRRHPGGATDPTIASRTGSILWHDHPTGRVVALGSRRFPVACADFSQSGHGDPGALWRITVLADLDGEGGPDPLDAPVARSIRLVINSRNKRVVNAVTEGWRDAGSTMIRSMLNFAVERELVLAALRNHQRLMRGDSVEGSLKEALRTRMLKRFPDCDIKDLARQQTSDPSAFETHLQARLGLLAAEELA